MKLINKVQEKLSYLTYLVMKYTSPTVKSQFKNSKKVPVIIINYNQLFYLEKLVEFLLDREIQNIIIIDNKSDYQPLLQYYEAISSKVTVEIMDKNYGHMVFFQNEKLRKKYGRGFYFLTDADIVPNPSTPIDFVERMIFLLEKYFSKITKVGFALEIQDIPEYYHFKDRVQKWETQFWNLEVGNCIFKADIDTTFALYKPCYPDMFNQKRFLQGLRLGGEFVAKHGGWYIDHQLLTEEQKHYIASTNDSASWSINVENEKARYS